VLFLLDATASMQDNRSSCSRQGPDLAELMVGTPGEARCVALTVYRPSGLFRTRTFDFTSIRRPSSPPSARVRARGGNDTPRTSGRAARRITKPSWRGPATAKIVVLVTDAPPHLDAASPSYLDSVERAAARGVSILPVASSGIDRRGEFVLRDLAQATLGTVVVQTRGADGTSPGAPMPHAVREDDLSASSSDRIIRSSLQRRLDAVDS
jgi:hypothetical protein